MRSSHFKILALLLSALPSLTHAEADKPKTPLGEQMSAMNKSLRTLRRQFNDPAQKEASLGLVVSMEGSAGKAKALVPQKAKEVPEKDREQFIAAYQKKIDELLENFHKLEAAIREGNNDEAKSLMDRAQDLKRKGHEQFTAEHE